MANAAGRFVSEESVQQHIKVCLKYYMSRTEAMYALFTESNIEPHFTDFVWKRIEAINQEFFKAYNTLLIVKEQISRYNELLVTQALLMSGAYTTPLSGGSVDGNSAYISPQPHVACMNSVHNPYAHSSGTYSQQQHNQVAAGMPSNGGRIDVCVDMGVADNSNVGRIQGVNIQSESNSVAVSGISEPHNVFREEPLSSADGGESSMNPFGVELGAYFSDADIADILEGFNTYEFTDSFGTSSGNCI